jgi:ABC-type phosphate/phosphonate transport system substrate-binding protein
MIRLFVSLSLCALALSACGSKGDSSGRTLAPPLSTLRIGFTGIGTGKCTASGPTFSAPLTAYLKHLSERLEIPVEACPLVNRAEGAKKLAGKAIDMTLLDPASYAPVAATVRPFLTKRLGTLGRTETVLVATDASPIDILAKAEGKRLIFAGKIPVMWDEPQHALRDAKLSKATLGAATATSDSKAAMVAIRAGTADAMVLHSAAYTRLCRGASKSDKPCAGLREVWRGRPIAPEAWAMRRDMPPETWVRLVGIHIALFSDAPDIATWLAPGTTEIEPIEASGLGAPAAQ